MGGSLVVHIWKHERAIGSIYGNLDVIQPIYENEKGTINGRVFKAFEGPYMVIWTCH